MLLKETLSSEPREVQSTSQNEWSGRMIKWNLNCLSQFSCLLLLFLSFPDFCASFLLSPAAKARWVPTVEVDSDVVQAFSFKELTAKWEEQTSKHNFYTKWWVLCSDMETWNLWGRNSSPSQAQEVIFANTEPQETCSFNIRLVSGVWRACEEDSRTRIWKGRICQMLNS